MEIRKFINSDAISVSTLIKECFNTIDLGGHTEEGKRLQIEANSPQNLIKRAQSTKYFVASDKGRIIGICGYDKYKVQTLFVGIGFQNQGIGKALLHKILSEAIKEGLLSIDTWATFYSEKFYLSFGFERVGKIHLPDGKSDIVLIEMKKNLSQIKT
jgi:N-acetylglutamate synthase-like GNAT family acetyltransferase